MHDPELGDFLGFAFVDSAAGLSFKAGPVSSHQRKSNRVLRSSLQLRCALPRRLILYKVAEIIDFVIVRRETKELFVLRFDPSSLDHAMNHAHVPAPMAQSAAPGFLQQDSTSPGCGLSPQALDTGLRRPEGVSLNTKVPDAT